MSQADFKAMLQRLVREAVVGELSDETMRNAIELFRQALGGDVPAGALEQEDLYLSQSEAAVLAGVSVSTIRNWQTAGHLAKHHRGRVSRAGLREFLAKGATRAVPVALPDTTPAANDAEATAKAILEKRKRRHG